jgi:hypothetical protein
MRLKNFCHGAHFYYVILVPTFVPFTIKSKNNTIIDYYIYLGIHIQHLFSIKFTLGLQHSFTIKFTGCIYVDLACKLYTKWM